MNYEQVYRVEFPPSIDENYAKELIQIDQQITTFAVIVFMPLALILLGVHYS